MAHLLTIRTTRSRKDGVALVEMALVLPLLLLLVFGVMEYGWMFLKAEQVADSARHGARYAATPDATLARTGAMCQSLLNQAGITTATVAVPTGIAPGTGNSVTVQITVPYKDLQLLGLSFLPVPQNLTSSVTMLKEGS